MRAYAKAIVLMADVILVPAVYAAALLLKWIRKVGMRRLPRCRGTLMSVGVFPIQRHYYEPQFDHRNPACAFDVARSLPGIEWNLEEQLALLSQLTFANELSSVPFEKPEALGFYWNNSAFKAGDAEYWYQIIRALKPRKVIEIGSGYSTLLAVAAISKNVADDSGYECEHVCIEPYEQPWLESLEVSVVRSKVEGIPVTFFNKLQEGDILFIDSSHIIRPQGDVLFEYLELLPTLAKGVIVHVHDIFSPRNYLRRWLEEDVKFWNEQYLLEAFLTHNHDWEIIGALNYLHHGHNELLHKMAPHLTTDSEPGSMYIRKIA